jgi:AraC family L-rhamnose operon regulatory protein RhaS
VPAVRRHVLEAPELPLPELRMLGRTSQRATDGLQLERHVHHGAWELCWFARGAADWYAGDGIHELAAGWCYLTRPDEPHGSLSGYLEACDLQWAIIAPPGGRLPGLPPGDAEALAVALRRTPHAFPAPDLGPYWGELWQASRSQGPLATVAARTALHRLLLAAIAAAGAAARRPSQPIARALQRIDEGPATVPALARAAGLSRSVLHARFKRELGDSPAALLRRRRLSQAKRLLWRSDLPVTTIAQRCGYATSQRFATTFRESTGLSPLAWRQRARRFAAG